MVPSTKADSERLSNLGHTGSYMFPVDDYLGVSMLPFKMTVGTMLTITKEAIRCESFEETQNILKERSGIKINDDTIRMVTNTIGTLVYNNDMTAVRSLFDDYNSGKLTFPEDKKNDTLYLEVDGAMVATRAEDNKGTIYKENKLGMVFSTDHITWWTDKHGVRQHRINKREYTAHIGDCETFTQLMFEMSHRNGYGAYQKTVLISDGATWIRNMKNTYYPDAQQILDFYHLKEHVANYAKILYNYNENNVKQFTDDVMKLFALSHIDEAMLYLRKSYKIALKDILDKLLSYITNNIDNIDYYKYRQAGLFIGSGAIESSNRTVLQRRLKYGAMRWKISSAQSLVTLVAKLRSNLWKEKVVKAVSKHYGITWVEPGPVWA